MQLRSIEKGDFNGLEPFYKTREGILDIIRKIDEMIEKAPDLPDAKATVDEEVRRRQIIVCLQLQKCFGE